MSDIILRLSQELIVLKNNSGQVLYYFLVLIVMVVISWAIMLNIAQLIRNRMILQNKADNIAVSLATYKARVLNFLGVTNYLIGVILSLGMNPEGVQLASYSTNVVGGFPATMLPLLENPLSDLKHSTLFNKRNTGVQRIKQIVDILQKLQGMAVKSYSLYYYNIIRDNINKDYNIALFPVKPHANLGLKRNSKGIQYYSTINDACIYLDYATHFHFLSKRKYKRSRYSWLVEGHKFSEQKIKVILSQKINNKKPLLARFLGIRYPRITVYSAAAPYNVSGSMFPKKEDTFTGAIPAIRLLIETVSFKQFALMVYAIMHASAFGPYAMPFIAVAETLISINYLRSKENTIKLLSKKDNPIDAYLKSKNGGWAAHLVPYGGSK
jgi:hypothetical protein